MSLTVAATERGGLRVFALSMNTEQAQLLRDDPRAMASALGVDMDTAQAEVIAIDDLEGVGLVHYLSEGMGVPMERLTDDRPRLAALAGYVLIVLSSAFGGQSVALKPIPELTLIGAYQQHLPDWTPAPVTSDSAKPYPAPIAAPAASSLGRRKTLWLVLVLAASLCGLVWVMIK